MPYVFSHLDLWQLRYHLVLKPGGNLCCGTGLSRAHWRGGLINGVKGLAEVLAAQDTTLIHRAGELVMGNVHVPHGQCH